MGPVLGALPLPAPPGRAPGAAAPAPAPTPFLPPVRCTTRDTVPVAIQEPRHHRILATYSQVSAATTTRGGTGRGAEAEHGVGHEIHAKPNNGIRN